MHSTEHIPLHQSVSSFLLRGNTLKSSACFSHKHTHEHENICNTTFNFREPIIFMDRAPVVKVQKNKPQR
jgi:hypothetical protein